MIGEALEKAKELIQNNKLLNEAFKRGLCFSGIPDSGCAFATASIFLATDWDNQILVVLANNSDAEQFHLELQSFLPEENLVLFTGPENIPYENTHWQGDWKRDRIIALHRITEGKKILIICSVSAFLKKVPENLHKRTIKLSIGDDIPMQNLLKDLVSLGYERTDLCEKYGEFSLKGGILDVFSPASQNPFRIDFFGDSIDEIRLFDPESQKSAETTDKIILFPSDEFVLSAEEEIEFVSMSEKAQVSPMIEEVFPLFHPHVGLLKLFPKKPLVVFPRLRETKERAFAFQRELNVLFQKKIQGSISLPPTELFSFQEEFEKLTLVDLTDCIQFQLLPGGETFPLKIEEVTGFRGKIREAKEKFLSLINQNPNVSIILTSSFNAQLQRLAGLFPDKELPIWNKESEYPKPIVGNRIDGISFAISELKSGFHLPDFDFFIYTDHDLFGRQYKKKNRYKKQSSQLIESFVDLKEGDHVVHIHHGIGKFIKIQRTKALGKERDFLQLEYFGGDTLFVPLDQISLVQKYIGGTDTPRLDSIGKNSWKKAKDKAMESIDRLAEELVDIYAERQNLKGFSFPADTIWQQEFEAQFEYEETPDQISAIESVKQDLESDKPMDRLICGDVGYGKTEVAIRAAFKVMMAGKQVLLLSPTTILALQHFETFQSRFKDFPLVLSLVTRFQSSKETKDNLLKFEAGKIDMLVGTHAILSSKVKPKNLGLLVIDEEQKFGVAHKEAIKKYKSLVDVLTLSATPIPRTLHMALTGIRELSLITTPPKNRQSIETYVLEFSEDLIKEAIRKEILRGGQIFYLYNRVESIEEEASFLRSLMPEVAVGILHGQLTEDEIGETLIDFYQKKYDVLVTTTIIESGIDMPNVNTLVVKDADRFGLSQLYQIRGRVGRSEKKAFAYFFYPERKLITEQAEKRLNTIFEYQELGSGFKVAMRDLEIRGAGNLLGKEQSGDIAEIGFDLYLKLLEEAIARKKGEVSKVEIRSTINLNTNFYLPDDYISDTKQKIEFYKRLEGAQNLEEVEFIGLEMQDRFGNLPVLAETFVALERIRAMAQTLGFESITEKKGEIYLKSGKYFSGDTDRILGAMEVFPGLSISPKDSSVLRYTIGEIEEQKRIKAIDKLLRYLSKKMIDNRFF